MAANRISHFGSPVRPASNPPVAPPAIPPGFVVCPSPLAVAHAWQQEIYRQAYERAQAAVQIPRHHRMLFSVWN
jgi:hypothetical protein